MQKMQEPEDHFVHVVTTATVIIVGIHYTILHVLYVQSRGNRHVNFPGLLCHLSMTNYTKMMQTIFLYVIVLGTRDSVNTLYIFIYLFIYLTGIPLVQHTK